MSVLKDLRKLKGNKKEALRLIKANKEALLAEKKNTPKNNYTLKIDENIVKASGDNIITPQFDNIESLGLKDGEVFIVGNSVGFFDGHEDVSLKGSWTKTVKDKGTMISIVKDHNYLVDNLFAKNNASIITELPIKALGYDMSGTREVIGFKISPYNELDLRKYQDGTINQHSMGLEYVKIVLCINDTEFPEEYKSYNTYIEQVVNKEAVEEVGYFWGVQEQKAREGSAVVMASNIFTPAFTNKSLQGEPLTSTQIKEPIKNNNFYSKLIRNEQI